MTKEMRLVKRAWGGRTSYLAPALPSGSESSGKLSFWSSANLAMEATSSRLMPKTWTPSSSNWVAASRSEQTSRVHPGVAAFG